MEAIASAFIQHYYSTFDSNRQLLASLYADTSMLTFEGSQCLGTHLIMTKLVVRLPLIALSVSCLSPSCSHSSLSP